MPLPVSAPRTAAGRSWVREAAPGDRPHLARRICRIEDEAAALLREVAAAGVAFEHPAIDYVEIQVDRRTWEQIKETAR